MKLSNYLDNNFIFLEVEGESAEQLIGAMVDSVSSKDKYFKRYKKAIKEDLLNREQTLPTAIGEGIFLPHTRSPDYKDVMLAVGIPKKRVSVKSLSGELEEIKIIFLVVVPEFQNRILLSVMGAISQMASEGLAFDILRNAKTTKEIVDFITDNQPQFDDQINAEHILEAVPSVNANSALHELASKLICEGYFELPVVDNGKFIGKVGSIELIKIGMPKEALSLSNLGFLRSSEPFEDYFKMEKKLKVGDICKKALVVDRKASVLEVAFLMVKKKVNTVYVVERGKYIGRISAEDIVKKVLHL
ncbi:MAG TPA: hypothetical protein DEP20_01160 [Fusobacteria bacterium]|nr:hypothetical protein [Fusobacteriota bacterium]|tara:strand:+ start:1824 stop:2732 length:909 start_codon:yes stop_codon:yes gene_type:complete